MVVSRIANTLWLHKKKSIFTVVVGAYGVTALRSRLRDDQTRHNFAERAQRYGLMRIEPTQRLRRVTVLINREAGGRRAADLFKRNALPLLNLAGLQVNVLEVSSASEMESLCRVLDASEADCIYLVGGDGTLSRALVGLSQNNAPLPVGLFPGGRKNRAFCRIFQPKSQRKEGANLVGKDSVQIFCESAMALIEGEERCVYPVKCTITKETNDSSSDDHEVNAPNTFWLLSDLCAGWFEHCEQRAPKLWWWGPLRYHFVYFWEFLKRKPTPLDLRISYEEFCPGCNRCVVPIKQKNLTSFWSLFTRFLWNSYTDNSNAKPNPDFTLITNPKCGQKREVNVSGADVRLNVEQAEIGSKMRLRVGGGGDSFGRWAAVRFGWHSLAEGKRRGEKTEQSDGHFYVLDIEVDRAELQFTHIPVGLTQQIQISNCFTTLYIFLINAHLQEFVQKLSLAGEWGAFEQYESKKILLETTKEMGEGRTESPLHFYVPKLPMP